MDYRVDEKGKYYTKHVNKRAIAVVAQIENNLVHGTVYLSPDNRLKEEINGDDNFIAITQAQVIEWGTERLLFQSDLLVVNKQRIVWISPRETTPTDTSN